MNDYTTTPDHDETVAAEIDAQIDIGWRAVRPTTQQSVRIRGIAKPAIVQRRGAFYVGAAMSRTSDAYVVSPIKKTLKAAALSALDDAGWTVRARA